MEIPFKARHAARLWWIAALLAVRSTAADFDLRVTTDPDPALAGQNLVYSIALTNLSGQFLSEINVTNRFPASAVFVAATNDVPATVTIDGAGLVRFRINSLNNAARATLTLTVRPTLPGPFTNFIGVGTTFTPPQTTNVVRTVFASQSDLAVALTSPAPPVYLNDWVTYRLLVTNAGPGTALGVVVSNTIPAGWVVQSVSPSTAGVDLTNHLVRIDVGSLAAAGSASWQVTARVLSEGAAILQASVYAPDVYDTNVVNNAVTNTVVVVVPVSGLLSVSLVSTQHFNPQTGLIEQIARLANTGSVRVAAARVVVAGLTSRLANAVGTNELGPFVVLGRALEPGESVDLLLEYFSTGRVPGPDPALSTYGVLPANSETPEGTGIGVSRILMPWPGRILLEFPATTGRVYAVVCADVVTFTNAWTSRPFVEAQASRVQWIDYGPPRTLNAVTNSTARFYRVLEVQP